MNINASSTSIYSGAYNFTTTAKSSTEETSKEEELSSIRASSTMIGANQSQDGDSVEISTDALAALENEEEETSTAETLASAASTATESSNDLSSYSESQLKDMVDAGEISQAQYNSEIASCTKEAESTEETATNTAQNTVNGNNIENAMYAQMKIDIQI